MNTSNRNITLSVDGNSIYAPYIPMYNTNVDIKLLPKWQHIGNDIRFGHVYQVTDKEIVDWIQSQPADTWKPYTLHTLDRHNFMELPVQFLIGETFTFTEEMESWFKLRWS